MQAKKITKQDALLWRSIIFKMALYEPGKPIAEVKREYRLKNVIKLASNENPLGASPKAQEILRKNIREINFYPDSNCCYVREQLGKKLDLSPNMFIVGSGSVEIMKWACESLLQPKDEVVVADICFPVYCSLASLYNAIPKVVPLDADFDHDFELMYSAISRKTKIVFLTSPNNPTGKLIEYDALAQFLEKVPHNILVVLDLAYIDYVTSDYGRSGIDLVAKHPNLLLTRSFSKIYGLAGLRIGYGIADEKTIEVLNRVRMPFSVNSLAQAAAIAALEDERHIKDTLDVNEIGKAYLSQAFRQLGLAYCPTSANFILVDTRHESDEVFQALLRKGIIVRPMRHPRLNTCIRVTIGTLEQNQIFVARLREILCTR